MRIKEEFYMRHYLSILLLTCILGIFCACSNTQSSDMSNNRDKGSMTSSQSVDSEFEEFSHNSIIEYETSKTDISTPIECTHLYALSSCTEATCTEDGLNVYVCTICEASYTEQLPSFGHDWISATSKSPKTCRNCAITEGNPLEYDAVLASGDGYSLVKIDEETYNSATTKYGVIDENGNWICPLSDKNGFALSADNVMNDGYNLSYGKLSFSYMNEGIFLVKVFCALVEEGGIPSGYDATYAAHCSSFIVRANGDIITNGEYMMTKYYDGYCFTTNKFGAVTRIDKDGNKVHLADRRSHTQWGLEDLDVPSCGLIYCNNAFYDIKTCEIAIDLSEYRFSPNTILSARKFSSNGTFKFYFLNPNHNEYVAIIDTNGDFIEPPKER